MSFLWFSGAFGLQYDVKCGIWTQPGDLTWCFTHSWQSDRNLASCPVQLHPLTLENCVDDPASLLIPVVRLSISVGLGRRWAVSETRELNM